METRKIFSQFVLSAVLVLFIVHGHAVASPYFAISQDDWQILLDRALSPSPTYDPCCPTDPCGTVAPMNPGEGMAYTSWLQQDPCDGDAYPAADFYQAELYLYDPNQAPSAEQVNPGCLTDYNGDLCTDLVDLSYLSKAWLDPCPSTPTYLDGKGLVMVWGNTDAVPGESTTSAWVFTYGEDPDLSNSELTITVVPIGGVNTVSFGFKDDQGRREAWWWNVTDKGGVGPIYRHERNVITIDTSKGHNLAAASPQAKSYKMDANFDITKVIRLVADENNVWRNGINVPAPGRKVQKAWNYWYDLSVAPIEVLPVGPFYKWRQPARYAGRRTRIWGWDEVSVHHKAPVLADDWLCIDSRKVTGVRFWGSFSHWRRPTPPPVFMRPIAFRICVWDDTPGHLQDITQFSHPNTKLWEYITADFTTKFVGWDRDPARTFHPITDACFRFDVDIPQGSEFVQDPDTNCIYWLSIEAIYAFPIHYCEWGWKTRPHYFNDTAVRITNPTNSAGPIGTTYVDGNPVEYPQRGVST